MGDDCEHPGLTSEYDDAAQLRQAVELHLESCGYWYLRKIEVETAEDAVFIRGKVPTFYLKQIAQNLVGQVDGVEKVVNEIEVVVPDTWHHVQNT